MPAISRLLALQGADRPFQQQLRSLADVGQRRLQFVRDVTQESLALLRHLEQPLSQPLDLAAEGLEVRRRTPDVHGFEQAAVPEVADGAVDVADRPADEQREYECETERDRGEGCALPQQASSDPLGLLLHADQFPVDLLGRQQRESSRVAGERAEFAEYLGADRGLGRVESVGDEVGPATDLVDDFIACLVARKRRDPFEDCRHAAMVLVEDGLEFRSPKQLVEARGTFHGRHLPDQGLAVARGLYAMDDEALAGFRQAGHFQGGTDDAREQRQRDQQQADQDQAAE